MQVSCDLLPERTHQETTTNLPNSCYFNSSFYFTKALIEMVVLETMAGIGAEVRVAEQVEEEKKYFW